MNCVEAGVRIFEEEKTFFLASSLILCCFYAFYQLLRILLKYLQVLIGPKWGQGGCLPLDGWLMSEYLWKMFLWASHLDFHRDFAKWICWKQVGDSGGSCKLWPQGPRVWFGLYGLVPAESNVGQRYFFKSMPESPIYALVLILSHRQFAVCWSCGSAGLATCGTSAASVVEDEKAEDAS